jgi:hypothetical protein
MLWAYLSFSQFLIIWSANLPEEIPHYLNRWENSWRWPQRVHRRRALHDSVRAAAVTRPEAQHGQAAAHRDVDPDGAVADYYWHVRRVPHRGFNFSLLDFALPLALGGIFISLFVSNSGGRSLLPVNDPQMEKALHHHVH